MAQIKKKVASLPLLEMYAVAQAAHYLGVHSRTILREIHRGNLEAYTIGKGYKVKRAELDRYLEQRRVGRTGS
jgi:excisionase family DNA binding protein